MPKLFQLLEIRAKVGHLKNMNTAKKMIRKLKN